MLLTITLEAADGSVTDATALSHLLRKHPEKVQAFPLPIGQAHVFYPEVSAKCTTAALLVEVDPIGLVRNKRFRGDSGMLDYYINDRPFVASSLMSVAIGKVFRSAMTGTSEAYPDLAAAELPLRIEIPVISTRGGDGQDLANRLFAPLGWTVEQDYLALDEQYPQWGHSHYSSLVLSSQARLDHALRQLYVLLPVLDDSKHYWVNDDEAVKLARQGEGWLENHPERELISYRYLAHQKSLVQLAEAEISDEAAAAKAEQKSETGHEQPATEPLRVQRALEVLRALKDCAAQSVADVGCGPGALLRRLKDDGFFTKIIGTDVSVRSLEQASRALNLDEASAEQRRRIQLLHGSAVYRDERLRGLDAVVLMEVIEHVDPSRLPALEDSIFGYAAAQAVVVTTPNAEFNVHYPKLNAGTMRHDDHRFEWTRSEFQNWAHTVGTTYGYTVEHRGIGKHSHEHGTASQMAIFRKEQA